MFWALEIFNSNWLFFKFYFRHKYFIWTTVTIHPFLLLSTFNDWADIETRECSGCLKISNLSFKVLLLSITSLRVIHHITQRHYRHSVSLGLGSLCKVLLSWVPLCWRKVDEKESWCNKVSMKIKNDQRQVVQKISWPNVKLM